MLSRSVVSDSCNPIDCSLPGSSVHRILKARLLEWVAISFSKKRIYWPFNCSCVLEHQELQVFKASSGPSEKSDSQGHHCPCLLGYRWETIISISFESQNFCASWVLWNSLLMGHCELYKWMEWEGMVDMQSACISSAHRDDHPITLHLQSTSLKIKLLRILNMMTAEY